MMLLAHHIDSLIQIALGCAFTWMAFRGSTALSARSAKLLRFCGPALIVIGALLMLRPEAAPNWQRQFTSDRVASAEFPGSASTNVATAVDAAALTVTTLKYNVPGKDMALFLSHSALPEDARGLSDAQRIENTVDHFVSQGSRVVQNIKDAGSPAIYRITLRQDANKATIRLSLVYVGDVAYRVVASWTDGQEDKPLTDRFMNSFRVGASAP